MHVCAVAGSGKTTTMVERVKQLVQQEGVKRQHICILMFNRLARAQFEQKLEVTLPPELRPKVSTFHSYASRIIGTTINSGLMPNI